jgi:hypothetical protein
MPGLKLTFASNIREEAIRLRGPRMRLIQQAAVLAVNRTAEQARKAEEAEIRTRFDRPTPFTQKSLTVIPATPRDMLAEVTFKDYLRNPGDRHYLEPSVYGGSRPLKPFERRLAKRLLPPGWFAIPGPGARLDAYGNMSRGQIVQILSVVGALPTAGAGQGFQGAQTARSKKRNKKARDYFASTPTFPQRARNGKHLGPGIYERLAGGKRVRLVLQFVPRVSYRPRYPFFDIARAASNANFGPNLRKAVEQLSQGAAQIEANRGNR